jgi:LPXTG-site transpeptidase (sortase) family protein
LGALVVFWVSLAVLVGSVLFIGVQRWQAADEAIVAPVGERPDFDSSPSPSPTPTLSLAPTPSVAPSPSPSATGPVMVAAPMRVRIPALDVETKVFPVGLDKNDAIEIPEDIRYVGWYKLGVPPGVDRGSAVLVAHRDGREQGRGVFYYLGTLEPGDKVYVKTSTGQELPYKVVSRESILKKSLPYEELFAVDGDPRLTLISCGGYYDPDNGGYQDNVVVTAVPMFEPISTQSATASAAAYASPSGSPAAVANPQAATIAEPSPGATKKRKPKASTVAVPAPTSQAAASEDPEPTSTPTADEPRRPRKPAPVFSNSPTPTNTPTPAAPTVEASPEPALDATPDAVPPPPADESAAPSVESSVATPEPSPAP